MSYDYNLGEDFPGQFPSNPSPPPPYAFPQYPDFFHFLSTPLGSFDPALFTAGPKDPSPSTECEEGTVPATQMPACPYAPTAVPASALPLRASDDVDYAPSRPPARRSHRIVPPQKRVLNKQCCPFCSKWILKPCQFTIVRISIPSSVPRPRN